MPALAPDPTSEPAIPRPAATVVLLRPGSAGPEALLIQRPATMAFAPDMHAFPGGAVDLGDADAALHTRATLTPDDAGRRLGGDIDPMSAFAIHIAALRELFEETGVLLADAGGTPPSKRKLASARERLLQGTWTFADVCRDLDLRLRFEALAPLSRWVTPRFVPRRFDARFFVAELPSDARPSFATGEVATHRWLNPSAALAACAAGAIGLWVPTSATLQQLEHVSAWATVAERLGPVRGDGIRVVGESRDVTRVVLPGAGGVSGQSVNGYVVGRREVVVIDPGDPSEAALDAILEVARRRPATIRAVALTHADPDHHGGAEALASTLGIPVYAAREATSVLPSEIEVLTDGMLVPGADVSVQTIATPGHRADHLSFVLADRSVIAGDVVGRGPSRSVLGPADVPAWLGSLDRLESIETSRLYPGHGEPIDDPASAIAVVRASRSGANRSRRAARHCHGPPADVTISRGGVIGSGSGGN
jgi:glyoxylase-like metal-dependent hydrolase (beta-lactamase superfamily II)/8-oxo-dGTP pyrophosphatase MutT (NUDIX family)